VIFLIDGQFKYLLQKANFKNNTVDAKNLSGGIITIEFKKIIAAITGEKFYVRDQTLELYIEYLYGEDIELCRDLIWMSFNQK
jgi:hypothetical protein